MDNTTAPDHPETMSDDTSAVYHDSPPQPDSFYGVTMVTGEAIRNYFANRGYVKALNTRIGWLITKEELRITHQSQDGPQAENTTRFARAMWLNPQDCRRVLEAATLAEFPESPLTVHGISCNDDRYLSLTHSQRTIGYPPRDNSAEVLQEESGQ